MARDEVPAEKTRSSAKRLRAERSQRSARAATADPHGRLDLERRRLMVETARAMNACGINQGTSGNLSIRRSDGEGLWVTPSSLAYDAMTPAELVALDWTLHPADARAGARPPAEAAPAWRARPDPRPAAEWRLPHDLLWFREEFDAVLHAHPIHATAIACHGQGVPPFHYMVAVAGGRDLRCAPYALFGGQALSDGAVAALDGRKACLLAHHGMIACGRSLDQALGVSVEVETLCAQYLAALQIGQPPLLSDAEIDAVLDKIASGPGYGSA